LGVEVVLHENDLLGPGELDIASHPRGPRQPFCCQTTRNNGTREEGSDMTTIIMWAAIFALILLTRFGIPSISVWRRRRRKAP
jgi:hypothetical protein